MEQNKTIQKDNILSHDLPNCNLCSSSGKTLYSGLNDRLFGSSGPWTLFQCSNQSCRLIWLNPMPNEDEIWKAYQYYYTHEENDTNILPVLKPLINNYLSLRYNYYPEYNVLKKLLGCFFFFFPTERAEVDFTVLYLKNNEKGRLLDVGCGNGTFIGKMQQLGWETEGIDFDPKAIEYCKSKGLKAYTGGLESHKFPSGSFDIITINHVIEHIHDTKKLIEECFRILKPGGKLVIATPNSDSFLFRSIHKQNWFSLDPPRHLILFNKKNLSDIVSKSGFSIEKSMTTIRNEFWVHTGSRYIRKEGYFKGKKSKWDIVNGKLFQYMVWFFMLFNKNIGGEVVIKAVKP
jgi:2-polyprenyl-3-methyl-5-hydroxy-6-metoxy-1,4-benzoquinol methylase